MRADMAKVIVERPRIMGTPGSKPKGYRKQVGRAAEDEPPRREGMRRKWRGRTKSLNEHLGPLRRYLDAQVGRPWDRVFSEICARIDRGSAVQDHVRDHVAGYVTTHVLLIDGVPCSGEGDRGHGKPLVQLHRRWYVCPRTGLLRRVMAPDKDRQAPAQKTAVPRQVRVSDTLLCRRLADGWHLVTLQPLPPHPHRQRSQAVDVLLNRPVAGITPDDARRQYGGEVFAVASRRLGRRELRHYPIAVEWWDEGR